MYICHSEPASKNWVVEPLTRIASSSKPDRLDAPANVMMMPPMIESTTRPAPTNVRILPIMGIFDFGFRPPGPVAYGSWPGYCDAWPGYCGGC